MTQKLVSIIVPAYNEEAVLDIFHARISEVLATLPDYAWEILFINDGSTDATQLKIEALQRKDPRVGSILLSRNFGFNTGVQFMGYYTAVLSVPALIKLF